MASRVGVASEISEPNIVSSIGKDEACKSLIDGLQPKIDESTYLRIDEGWPWPNQPKSIGDRAADKPRAFWRWDQEARRPFYQRCDAFPESSSPLSEPSDSRSGSHSSRSWSAEKGQFVLKATNWLQQCAGVTVGKSCLGKGLCLSACSMVSSCWRMISLRVSSSWKLPVKVL